jgi:hypothetical protein
MKVDRAVFVAIRDNVTGTVVFMGSIADPAAIDVKLSCLSVLFRSPGVYAWGAKRR